MLVRGLRVEVCHQRARAHVRVVIYAYLRIVPASCKPLKTMAARGVAVRATVLASAPMPVSLCLSASAACTLCYLDHQLLCNKCVGKPQIARAGVYVCRRGSLRLPMRIMACPPAIGNWRHNTYHQTNNCNRNATVWPTPHQYTQTREVNPDTMDKCTPTLWWLRPHALVAGPHITRAHQRAGG